jgi:HSP90 family molecular chaperone
MFRFDGKKKVNNITLFVRRVSIMDNCEDLILKFHAMVSELRVVRNEGTLS